MAGDYQVHQGESAGRTRKQMTHLHERVSPHPLTDDVLHSEIDKQIEGIVGFEIDIEKVEASYKMSQNRDDENYRNIIAELEKLEDYNAKMAAKKMSEIGKIARGRNG